MGSLTLDWIQLAAALGAAQGILLIGVLLAQRRNRTANRLLAALMLAFTIYLLQGVYYATGMITRWPHFFGIGWLMPWIFGPLFYVYTVAASDRSWRITPRTWLHFVPFVVAVLAGLPLYLMAGADKVALYQGIVAGTARVPRSSVDFLKFFSGIAYSAATVLYLKGHRRRVLDSYSNTERVNLTWLLWLAGAAAAVWVLATLSRVAGVQLHLRDEHVSVGVALVVYAIGYMGLRQPEVFRYETQEWAIPVMPAAPAPAPQPEPVRYERSGLADGEADRLKAALLSAMEKEQPWKASELTLAQLAMQLDTTPHKLSEVLNSEVGQTFYDFVNGYRVREVQRRIQAGEAKARKMVALAYDAGFASKSTFNDAFKKHAGKTPTAYRESVGA